MQNKEKRSLILSLILGDGCIAYTSNRVSATVTIDHGLDQKDYAQWKADLLSSITSRNVTLRQGHRGNSCQLAVCMKRFKAWRKFCYHGGKKSIAKILPFITNPEFAVAVWLMDDGYVEPSIFDKSLKSARFRLFTCATPVNEQQGIIDWFTANFGVTPKIKMQKKKGYNDLPFLKLTEKESLVIWEKIREFVLQFDSMKYKFRYIETIYLEKLAQRTPCQQQDDIARHS